MRYAEDLDFTVSRGDSCTEIEPYHQLMQRKRIRFIHMDILDKEGGGT